MISDIVSGESIQLDAFGAPNTQVFLALLGGGDAASQAP